MKYFYTTLITIALVFIPATTMAKPDPHTNITPIEEYVANEIKAFNNYVKQAETEGAAVNLPEALDDLSGVLESYLRLTKE